ncbi:MAG: hypothetical protein ABI450_09040 [Rhizomicrobium sp.]
MRGKVRKRKAPPRKKPRGDAKALADVRKAAQSLGKRTIGILWSIASTADSDNARIAACKEILDRGYGKESRAAITESEHAVIRRIERIIVDPKN